MAIADAADLPVAAHVQSAMPHQVKLVEDTIDSGFTAYTHDKMVGDQAYDSDKLDDRLPDERGVEMIAAHPCGGLNNPPVAYQSFWVGFLSMDPTGSEMTHGLHRILNRDEADDARRAGLRVY